MAEKTKRYWWLKLREDFFTQTPIKKLRKVAGGDTYTIIYLKMQLISLREDGVITFENVEDSFESELALRLDESTEDVQMTVAFLRAHRLLEEISGNGHMLPEAVKNVDSESDSAARMRNLRERNREDSSQCDGIASLSAHNVVTCDTEKEKELELDIDVKEEQEEARERENRGIVFSSYMRIFGDIMPSHVQADLTEFAKSIEPEAITYVFDTALAEQKTTWSYVKTILLNYERAGVRTLEQAIARDNNRASQKAQQNQSTGGYKYDPLH